MNGKSFLTVAFFLLLMGPLGAQNRELGFRDVIALQAPGNVTITEDGSRIAFTLRDVDWSQSRFRSHIWVLDPKTRERRQFTFGESSESSPHFSPDGRSLAFSSSRKAGSSDSDDESSGRQIWLLSLAGGEARKLTKARAGVQGFSWNREGDRLFYTTGETLDEGTLARREERRKRRFDEIEYLETQYKNEIWSVDLDGNEKRIYAGMKGLSSVDVSPNGRQFAFASNQTGLRKDSPQTDLWIYDAETKEVRRLTTRPGAESNPTWSPDGRSILFSAPQDPETSYSQREYFLIPAAGGSARNLTQDLDRSPGEVLFVDGGAQLLMSVQEGVYTRLHRLDLQSGRTESLESGNIDVGNLSYARKSRQYVMTRQSDDTLPEIYLSSLGNPQATKLTNFSEQLAGYRLGRQEVISWTSSDGLQIEGILNYPVDYQPGQEVPLIVNPHGGPHGRYRNTFQGEYQVWANHGYATLSPNFRGSSGYGATFDVANKKDLGFGDYQDVMAGTDKVIAMGVADSERLGVHGGSYGGFMTNWIITHTHRFAAAVSKYGIWHILTDFSNSYSPRWEYNYLGVAYWDDWDLWKKHSPGSYSKNVTTPVLILHGEADPNTVLSNSREMFTALWLQGKTVEFVIYPREVHGIGGEPNHILDRQQRALAWWDKYLMKKGVPGIGETVTNGDWEMKVLAADSSMTGQKKDRARLKVSIELKQRQGEKESLQLDLLREAYLELDDQREISSSGLINGSGGNEWVLEPAETTLSQNSLYRIQLAFEVPADLAQAKLRFKDFPAIRIEF